MAKIKIPRNIRFVLDKLDKAGYEAWCVGGCVRDSLLGREPKDWDITTNAKPEKIKEVFKDYTIIDNNGEKHGTVTVRYNDENIEITTYRVDGEYVDSRHPESVSFTEDIEEDLARRDFTINAIAGNVAVEDDVDCIIDPFEGVADLHKGIIRAVGNPEDRFEEDALRILRGIRFACRYNFNIDFKTKLAMLNKKDKLKNISKERILTEIKEIFNYHKIGDLMQDTMINIIICDLIPEFKTLNAKVFSLFENNAFITNFAGLLSLIPEYNVEEILNRFGFSKVERKKLLLLSIFSKCKYNFTDSEMIVKIMHIFIDQHHYTKEDAYYMVRDLIEIQNKFLLVPEAYNKDYEYNSVETLNKTVKERCICIKDLAINGNDLVEMQYKGEEIGEILQQIFKHVSNGTLKNDKETLIYYAIKIA